MAKPGHCTESVAPESVFWTPTLWSLYSLIYFRNCRMQDCVLTWSHCHGHLYFLATFSWGGLVTECRQRRQGHWVPSPYPKGGAGLSEHRTGLAERTWKRPWRGKWLELLATRGDNRNDVSQRPGLLVGGQQRGAPGDSSYNLWSNFLYSIQTLFKGQLK